MNFKNCKTNNYIIYHCEECKSKHIYYDTLHDELFCGDCGLVLLEHGKQYYDKYEKKQ